ncbi:type 1 glutamine amidotransferase domain-containing protein [Thalassotalea sp. PLHSN55]|uniref:type 1 glutamine amidotransferase domain-containing protein n=1 Tax=Thalassotalea sp. PLHSN55 TaxID=3435888 RepID=UPI003F83AFE2
MKHILNVLMVLALLLITSWQVKAQTSAKKVVMVLSSYGQQQGDLTPGYEFDEFSKAYQVFKANGIAVDLASPKGGMVEADKYDPSKPYNVPVLADKAIMAKLDNTLKTGELDAKNYDGIFIVGGKGAMFDLPKDKALQQVIADIYQQQGSVAAVCHGPAALIDVKLADGSYLIANKAVNGFTNQEERLFGKKWLKQFEFMLEDKLIERGGKYQSSDIMLSHVAVDERLVTGQNPSSTVGVATELVKQLGLIPVELAQDIEDKTLAEIAQFLSGDTSAIARFNNKPNDYHIPLVGMYGFYYLKAAESTLQHQNSLALMLVAQEALNNATLDLTIAKTQHKLGQIAQAKATVTKLIAAKPDYQPAQTWLKELSL